MENTNTPIIRMLSVEEERLVSLFSNIIVSTTLKELYEKRNTLPEILQ